MFESPTGLCLKKEKKKKQTNGNNWLISQKVSDLLNASLIMRLSVTEQKVMLPLLF